MKLRNGKIVYRNSQNIWHDDILVFTNYIKNIGGSIQYSDILIAIREGGCLHKLLKEPHLVLGKAMHYKCLRKNGAYLTINE